MGVFALLSTTLFSCSADEDALDNQSATKIKELNPIKASASEPDPGPGDDQVIIQPPKK